MSRTPRREKTRAIFLQKSNFEARAKAKFADKEVVDVAMGLAKQIGSFAAEDELEDEDYIEGLVDVILSVAPHKALIQAFQDFNKEVTGNEASLDQILDLFSKTRIAEMASYSQIASERVRIIRELEKIVLSDVNEDKFQRLIAEAPWLIESTWSVISKNQALKTFKTGFERFWKQRTGEEVTLAIEFGRKRPDFTLVSVGHMLHIVEIKTSGHKFNDKDFERMINYVYAFREFFNDNKGLSNEFPSGWQIDLIADGVNLRKLPNKASYQSFIDAGEVKRTTWHDFLTRSKTTHQTFLDVNDKVKTLSS